jgi:hypothetical protein
MHCASAPTAEAGSDQVRKAAVVGQLIGGLLRDFE